jgi:hypothetical protein
MGRQEETCWRCGAEWASEEVPPTSLRVIAGSSAGTARTPVAVIAIRDAEAVPQAAAGGRR